MTASVFDIFKIGIGPSSSHTVGPMRAAAAFASSLLQAELLARTAAVSVELRGSLGATGKGHGSDTAVILGLEGAAPDTIESDSIPVRLAAVASSRSLRLLGRHRIDFDAARQIGFYRQALPEHPNGMVFRAFDGQGGLLRESRYISVGGGFIRPLGATHGAHDTSGAASVDETRMAASGDSGHYVWAFRSGDELLEMCQRSGMSIAQLMRENERASQDDAAIDARLDRIWQVMQDCVARGIRAPRISTLPGPLQVRRRAPELFAALEASPAGTQDALTAIDWLSLYAIAVNEENAAGSQVVTAPTNGAAGIIPAVLHYYMRFVPGADLAGVRTFLFTAAAVAALYKLNASISGAEVGCQGEVGVACSMAAAGLAAVSGGTPQQVENAAEIGMEHNLGLTCDPVGGRVQIPCIERNAMGAVKAVNAARMAMRGDGSHYVSLDSVIKTMLQTGADMKTKYKETSRGGLAVNIVEC